MGSFQSRPCFLQQAVYFRISWCLAGCFCFKILLASSCFDSQGREDADFVQDDQGHHHGQGCHDGVRDGCDDLCKGKQDEIRDPPLFAQDVSGQNVQPHQDDQYGWQLKCQTARQHEKDHEGDIAVCSRKKLYIAGKQFDQDMDHAPQQIISEKRAHDKQDEGGNERGENDPPLIVLQTGTYITEYVVRPDRECSDDSRIERDPLLDHKPVHQIKSFEL